MKAQKYFTGRFGVVLLLDTATKSAVRKVAHLFEEGNSIHFGNKSAESHLTLYHSKFEGVPENVVEKCLGDITRRLPVSFNLFKIVPYGEKFLFWNIEKTAQLTKMHMHALASLSPYFIATGTQQADREKLTLSDREWSNVRAFGHPLVGHAWQPHVTLGYFPNSTALAKKRKRFKGVANRVAFVQIGDAGSIRDIITIRQAP